MEGFKKRKAEKEFLRKATFDELPYKLNKVKLNNGETLAYLDTGFTNKDEMY